MQRAIASAVLKLRHIKKTANITFKMKIEIMKKVSWVKSQMISKKLI